MKYGQFIFECKCGNKVKFEPEHQKYAPCHDKSIYVGLESAEITSKYEQDEYICGVCSDAIATLKNENAEALRDAVKNLLNKRSFNCGN